MKAWRKQPCPRDENGSKRKGVNRRMKEHDNFVLPIGVPNLLRALFKRAGIEEQQR